MRDRQIERILLTTDTVGGVWTFSIDLARHLSQAGVHVVMAALGGLPTPEQITDAERVPGLCLLTSTYKLEWMDDPWSDVEESGKWLLRIEREYRPDVIHLNAFGHGKLPWQAPVVLTAHSCVLSWWKAVHGVPAPFAWDPYRDVVTRSLHAADIVTAPSSAMAATLGENYELPLPRVRVIPNGSDPGNFRGTVKEPFVFAAGRLWDEAKNIAAVADIATSLPWPVFVAGSIENPSGGTARLEGMHALGRLSALDMADRLGRAAIFVSPARYEPFGLSILEAGLSGCALVLGDIPSLREVWGDAALFVDPNDRDALQRALLSLIHARDFREEMSRRSYHRALTFDAARTAQRYLHAYSAAVADREVPCAS